MLDPYISYPMFLEPTITQVPSGFYGYAWLDTKILFKKNSRKYVPRQNVPKPVFHPDILGGQFIDNSYTQYKSEDASGFGSQFNAVYHYIKTGFV